MTEFWKHSGLQLLETDADGWLKVTDDLLRAWLFRPEIRPVEESCAAERALHESLVSDPRQPIAEATLAALADADVRDNYRILLGFFARLVAQPTLEAAYLAILREAGGVKVAPLFVDQLAHMIVQHVLQRLPADKLDPFACRAAELFFREQRVTIQDQHILCADAETVDMQSARAKEGTSYGNLGRLLVEAQTTLASVELDIMAKDNMAGYWERDERHDYVLAINHGRPGLDAFARVMEAWVSHFYRTPVSITPMRQIESARLTWFVGLDREATSLLNALYNGEPLKPEEQNRLLALFRLEFGDAARVRQDLGGRPVFMALAMEQVEGQNRVRMKPQNLLLNLPLAELA